MPMPCRAGWERALNALPEVGGAAEGEQRKRPVGFKGRPGGHGRGPRNP